MTAWYEEALMIAILLTRAWNQMHPWDITKPILYELEKCNVIRGRGAVKIFSEVKLAGIYDCQSILKASFALE